jgi:hypothetical protein
MSSIIPTFVGEYLPVGIHPCDEKTLHERMVAPYQDPKTRKCIYEGFMKWREEVLSPKNH